MTIEEYRAKIVATAYCPQCEATPGARCTKREFKDAKGHPWGSLVALDYIHDDRSAVYHEWMVSAVESVRSALKMVHNGMEEMVKS